MGNSAIQQILATTDEKVKASLTDNTPDFLDGKVDGTSVDVNVSDKLVVLPAGVDHNSLNNYDANKHIDHTAVSISAGAGLTGGGTIAANRSLAVNPNGLVDTTIAAGDEIIFGDVNDSNNPKKDTVQGILDLVPSGSGLSNIVFSWYGSEHYGANNRGVYTSSLGINPVNGGNAGTLLLESMTGGLSTVVYWKFKKISSISTLTVYCRLWIAQAGTASLKAYVDTLTHTTITTTSTSPAWLSPQTIDISSLTDGTVYDGTIQMGAGSTSIHALCSSLVIIGS